MTPRSLLCVARTVACFAYILIALLATPVLAAPEIVAAPGSTLAPATAVSPASTPLTAVPAGAEVNLETANPRQPLTAPLYWRLDKTGRVTPEEVLSPAQQSFFIPFPAIDIPKAAGTSWFRLSLAPYAGQNGTYYLDLNTRVSGQIPKGQRVWMLREGQPHIQLHTETPGLYLLPESTVPATIFVRTEGLPAVGFAPVLRNAATLTVLDADGAFWIGIALAVALLFGLLRGIFEQREWRMWAALYAGTLLVTNAWGFPATPDGKVLLLDLPGLLAPGIALLLLPHVGRHILRSREHSTILDIQFILIGLIGLVLCLLPMLSNHVWTIRYLPLWPLGMLLLVPTTLQAMFQKINGSGRFLTICLLPPLGLVSFASLPTIQFASPEDAGLWTSLLSLLPSLCLCASSLLIALAPTPKHENKTRRAPTAETAAEKLNRSGGESPLQLAPKPVSLTSTPPLVLDDASRMTPPAVVESALPLHNLERRMRGPLDVLLNEIGTLEQMNLPRNLVDHAHRLSRAGRQLSLLVGEISSGRHGAPVVVRQKSGMEASAQTHAAPFDLYDVILQAHNAVAELAEAKNLALSWFTAPHLTRTYNGQGERLLRVLTLLAESAVHATDRGIVQIRVQRLPESNDPGMLQFTVSDTGKGAPPLQRSSISLVQVWELVGPTGGTLNVESGPTGTSIAFSMRFQAMSAEAMDRTTRETASPALRSEMCNALRILVVSDVPGSRQLLCYYLDELPHEVREARSVDEALGMYMQAPGALLVFDGDLPEADVVRAIAAIRAFEGEHGYPLSSILALVKDDEQIERLRRAGCTHSLLKPVSRTELRQLALRLAPVPRSRSSHRPETPPAPTASRPSGTASASGKPGNVTEKKTATKLKNSWSLLSPLSMNRKEESETKPAGGTSSTLPPLAVSPVSVSSAVSAPRPIEASTKPPLADITKKQPITDTGKKPPLPELRTIKSESVPVEAPKAAPKPVLSGNADRQTSAMPATPVSAPKPTPASAVPVQLAPPLPEKPTTAQILDEMVRDAEDRMTSQPVARADTPPRSEAVRKPQTAKPARQDTVRRAVDAVSAERKPMPWPGTRPRNADMMLNSPYAVGSESEWVSEPRPVGSKERTTDDKERAAIHVTARPESRPDSGTPAESPALPVADLPKGKSGGLVGSIFSVFKKKPQPAVPPIVPAFSEPTEWVSEPRPITRRTEQQPAGLKNPQSAVSVTPARNTAAVSQMSANAHEEWVSEPRPMSPRATELPKTIAQDEATPAVEISPDTARRLPNEESFEVAQISEISETSALPEVSAISETAETPASHIDPLAPVDFVEPDVPAGNPEPPATSAVPPKKPTVAQTEPPRSGRKVSRKVTFQPLLLPGLESDAPAAASPDKGLELHFSTAHAEQENVFNLTEIVDDSSELAELPLDPDLKAHHAKPVAPYKDDDHSPQNALRLIPQEEYAASAPHSGADAFGVQDDTSSLEQGGASPVEHSDDAPVEEQLARLEALSGKAQEAFASDDVLALRETAAQLALTASSLGMHGLIDLARCLEEVAADPEATASLLENIEAAVRDERL